MAAAPIADSVRLALPAEARQIAAVQRRAWQQLLPASLSGAALTQVTLEEMAELWHRAILQPPESRFRVMVAVAERQLVGFGTTIPSDDPDADAAQDGQIDEFAIDPPAQRRGHGSRLMNALIDTLRADGFVRATHWISTTDDVRRQFFTAAGWAADGGHRELGVDEAASDGPAGVASADAVTLKQIRLHTDIQT